MKPTKFEAHPLRHLWLAENHEEADHFLTFLAGYTAAANKNQHAIIREDLRGAAQKLFDNMLFELERLFMEDPNTTMETK